jgi:hypothetical protein
VFWDLGGGVSLKLILGSVKDIFWKNIRQDKVEDISGFLTIKSRPHLTNSTCCGTHNSGELCVRRGNGGGGIDLDPGSSLGLG